MRVEKGDIKSPRISIPGAKIYFFRHISKEKCEKFWRLHLFVLHLHTKYLKIIKIMTATTVARIPASFRFQSTLLDELKAKAKASNRSLNNYVESLLINLLHPATPVVDDNTITPELQEKINEARAEYVKGNFVRCSNKQELKDFLDSL